MLALLIIIILILLFGAGNVLDFGFNVLVVGLIVFIGFLFVIFT